MYTVLFVDDEEPILKVTEIMLSSLGIKVILVNSGKEAIKTLSNKDKRQEIDIICLDLTMPEMSGFEVMKWINEQKITIPVILQTGIEDKVEINKAMKMGMKNYLVKPYTKESLHQLIKKYAKDR